MNQEQEFRRSIRGAIRRKLRREEFARGDLEHLNDVSLHSIWKEGVQAILSSRSWGVFSKHSFEGQCGYFDSRSPFNFFRFAMAFRATAKENRTKRERRLRARS